MSKTVTIFGSSLPIPGDEEYENAYKLAKKLGEKNINICSGGYQGIMDAVSKGGKESGVKTIGITVDIFNSKPSEYLTEQISCDSLFNRLKNLIEKGDAYIILPGGTGTMLELSLVWEYFNKKLLDKKPVASVGKLWRNIVKEMEERISFEKRRNGLIKCFDNYDDCSDYIISKLT